MRRSPPAPTRRGGLLLCLLLAAACTPPGAEEEAAVRVVAEPPPLAPAMDPGALDQVTSVAHDGRHAWIGTESGVVRLDPETGEHVLLDGDDEISFQSVAALSLAPDGTTWSAHRTRGVAGDAGERRLGGVRALRDEGRSWQAWFEEDGLGSDDAVAVAAGADRVVVAAGSALAVLSLEEGEWRRELEESRRRLDVIAYDEELQPIAPRSVVEFRPRAERPLAVALDGEWTWAGTTHGLYRLGGEGLLRHEIPCRVEERVPRRVQALTVGVRGVVAVLALGVGEGEWRPGGLLELGRDGAVRCHEPGLDVPDAPSLDVAVAGAEVLVATYEGPLWIRGRQAVLLDEDAGAPPHPATAVAADSREGWWVGTWGGGAWRLLGRRTLRYELGEARRGFAARHEGAIRDVVVPEG